MDEDAGVWVRLLDDRVLTPARFNSLTAECKKRVQFVPIPFDNEDIGERLFDLHQLDTDLDDEDLVGVEDTPLSHRVSVVGSPLFVLLDKQRKRYVSPEEMYDNDGPYGPPGDARRANLVFRCYPKDLIDENGLTRGDIDESSRLLELDQSIVAQLRRRIYEWPPPPIPPTRALIDAVEALDGERIRNVLELDGPFKISHGTTHAALLRCPVHRVP